MVLILIVSHKVVSKDNLLVGYIIDDTFYTNHYLTKNMPEVYDLISNDLPTLSYSMVNKAYCHKLELDNPFRRDIQDNLLDWKNQKRHKVLQLEGCRQIGKTTELLKFAYKNYEYVIYVTLADDTFDFIGTVIDSGPSPLVMEKYCNQSNLPHYVDNQDTILIIDEIQINPKVYNAIRTLNTKLSCDIIVTGSYLGQTLHSDYFLPAGTISYLHMYPLSFSEFCAIFNARKLLETIDLFGRSNRADYDKLYGLYDLYKQIGGYPEVVKEYINSRDVEACYDIISNLLETFEKESRNYFTGSKETLIFKVVYTEAIKIMCSERKGSGNKLVDVVTQIVKDSQKMVISRDEISNAIQWLIYSGIIGECALCNNGNINDVIPARRLYYMDCGIASYIASQVALPESNLTGLLTETFAFAELYRLYATGYRHKSLKGDTPCFSTYNNFELDFMVLGKGNVVYGIEVKTDDGDPKSLKVYLENNFIHKGILAKNTLGGHGLDFDTIPIYTIARYPFA